MLHAERYVIRFSVIRCRRAVRVSAAAFEQFAAEILLILRPGAVEIGVVAHQLMKIVQLGVEIVELVQGDGFQRHRQLGSTEFVFAVMADDHVLEP